MLDILIEALSDTLKLLPYLFVTFLILELIEHKLSQKSQTVLVKNKKLGPIFGGLLGALPQCGFSAMASSLFSSKIITMGTLTAVFLSTSDEMLPIMLSEHTNFLLLLKIIGAKILIGIIIGFIVDLINHKKSINTIDNIRKLCEEQHCSCTDEKVVISSIKHTLKIGIFILIVNIAINLIIFYVGDTTISNILLQKNVLTYFVASLIGLIPNCASSIIITELYLSNFISVGTLFSGLLTGSGLGLLLLFKTNKNLKENILILSIIYFSGVVVGLLIDFII